MPYRMITFFALVVLFASAADAAEAVVIAEGISPRLPQQPQIAVDEAGTIHIVYGVQNDTYYVASTDGESLSDPVLV
jgi:hypothetical protein